MTNREWWELLNDIWKCVKKHNPPKTAKEWESAVLDLNRITERYGGNITVKGIMVSIIDEWWRERNGENSA